MRLFSVIAVAALLLINAEDSEHGRGLHTINATEDSDLRIAQENLAAVLAEGNADLVIVPQRLKVPWDMDAVIWGTAAGVLFPPVLFVIWLILEKRKQKRS
mmetsp:Transcript_23343/g.42212  ORF Transcript_23343/g.42212 Transcript_23343/m.42212 type:complete len:101 (-) Transcript_23343:116-418(-)